MKERLDLTKDDTSSDRKVGTDEAEGEIVAKTIDYYALVVNRGISPSVILNAQVNEIEKEIAKRVDVLKK